MNPTPTAIAAIDTQVSNIAGGWTNTDAELVAALNNPTVTNPSPQGAVPTPFTMLQLFAVLSSGSETNVRALAYLPNILADVAANNVANCLAWVDLLAGGNVPAISGGEATALNAIISATEPTPGYQSLIGWAQANLGRAVDAFDVAAARIAAS